MKTSGTFLSDMRAEILNSEYFKQMKPLATESEEIGPVMLAICDATLDYLLARLDPDQCQDIAGIAEVVCGKHAHLMASITMCLMLA